MAKKRPRGICWQYALRLSRFGSRRRLILVNEHEECQRGKASLADTAELSAIAQDVDMQGLTKQFVHLVDEARYGKLHVELDRLRQVESTLTTLLRECERELECATSKVQDLESQLRQRASEGANLTQRLASAIRVKEELPTRVVSQLNAAPSLESQLAGLTAISDSSSRNRGAEWQFCADNDEWISFPAERSEELHEHYERYSLQCGSPCVRITSGAEQYDVNLDTFSQKNVRTGTTRSIRCTIHAPNHWTRSVTLQAVHRSSTLESVEMSGFNKNEFNTVFYKSTEHVKNGYPVWFNRNLDVFMYSTRANNLAIYTVDQHYFSWREDRQAYYWAHLSQRDHPLQHGSWLQYVRWAWEPVAPTVVSRPPQCLGAMTPLNIIVEVVDDDMISKMRALLLSHSSPHEGAHSRKTITLLRVLRVENWHLWQQYQNHVEQVRHDLSKHGITAGLVEPSLPPTLQEFAFEYYDGMIDVQVNECFLFHGTSYDNAVKIAEEGFDVRFSKLGCYGQGTYFDCQACKSHQYATSPDTVHTAILSRVLLGDVHYAEKVDQNCRKPPARNGALRCCDSVVANPGPMPGHILGTQAHQEFVIFDKFQAYPEIIIQYMLDT
eukprot:TRINITY_DN24360_c1_g1_i2.p1 TRINITY_DN24360_c1_g1~~TRINITY_DN24360_c1_g1_i2.p1  ORF type:complete len:610 (+),score=48.36 TRINITY_DN24360_c1_g1_i2:42-1871(+)